MRFLRQSLTGLFLVSLTLGLLAYAGQTVMTAIEARLSRATETPVRRERVVAVRTTRTTEATVTPTLTAFGRIESRRTLEIRAQTGGVITELSPDFIEGGTVRAGQFLARIDPADAQSALERARTDLMDARAEEREAARALILARDDLTARRDQAELQDRALARQRDLEARGVGTITAVELAEYNVVQARQAVLNGRQAVAQAEARIDQAATATARAELALSEAERRLAETRITAGFSGTLSDVTLVEGRLVSANEKLALLVDGSAIEVAFRVSTPQYARLIDARGALLPAPVTVTLEAFGLDLTATGTVTRESAVVEEGTTGRVIFAALDSIPAMKPGDFVTVVVAEPPLERAIRLPAASLGPDDSVLILGKDDRLESLPVTLLRREGNDILVRAEGLAGLRVVNDRSPALGPGLKVRPLETAPVTSPPDSGEETVTLTPDRRARLMAYVESSADMTEAVKQRLLAQLAQAQVPARMVDRLEQRIGG